MTDNRPLAERVASLETTVADMAKTVGVMDGKMDAMLASQERAAGRAELRATLLSGIPSAVWAVTFGGLVTLIVYVWQHAAWK